MRNVRFAYTSSAMSAAMAAPAAISTGKKHPQQPRR